MYNMPTLSVEAGITGQTIEGSIVDYYMINISTDSQYAIESSFEHDDGDLDMYLYEETGTGDGDGPSINSSTTSGDSEKIDEELFISSHYKLVVEKNGNETYNLTITA